MSDAQKLRELARECRALAKSARNLADAAMLDSIAADLDQEAEIIVAEEKSGPASRGDAGPLG